MHPLVKKFEEKKLSQLKDKIDIKNIRVGDTLRVKLSVEEKGKKWVQTSEGVCIRVIKKGLSSTFTIRRVEKETSILMSFSPIFQDLHVDVLSRGKVRRAKLYYLERCSGKKGRLKALTHDQVKKLEKNKMENK
ncbi:50S ribosomal protein L19 [Alphaproteobacteria bacterium endosymbiont of Tiliacea citrago]|uniref:50S ribosomal protein L19 n=1 Tax=Alphaproteobacteria bacterium endosymbiont of Tiliacea citrago TaxID=3077944 RepID=UPI00313AA9E9